MFRFIIAGVLDICYQVIEWSGWLVEEESSSSENSTHDKSIEAALADEIAQLKSCHKSKSKQPLVSVDIVSTRVCYCSLCALMHALVGSEGVSTDSAEQSNPLPRTISPGALRPGEERAPSVHDACGADNSVAVYRVS